MRVELESYGVPFVPLVLRLHINDFDELRALKIIFDDVSQGSTEERKWAAGVRRALEGHPNYTDNVEPLTLTSKPNPYV